MENAWVMTIEADAEVIPGPETLALGMLWNCGLDRESVKENKE